MQLSLIDPRHCPVATAEMLGDGELRAAIRLVRLTTGTAEDAVWPYVERLIEVAGKPAWLVSDDGQNFVVIRGMVFSMAEFGILNARVRAAAMEAIAKLDGVPR